jgi:5-methylcytosine-specific restriction endonuclease McrA
VTPAELEALVEQFNGCCAYCGKPGTTIDHVVPLSKGGRDEIANVLPACKPCNSSKNNRDLSEWLASKGYADPRDKHRLSA